MANAIRGLDANLRRLARVGNSDYTRPLTQATEHVFGKMVDYPAKAQGAFTRLATPGQRRAFWAKVGRGEAQVGPGGYSRSDQLKQGWRKSVTDQRGTVTNAVDHSFWVQGERGRQPFHKASGWQTDEQVLIDERGAIIGFFEDEISGRIG